MDGQKRILAIHAHILHMIYSCMHIEAKHVSEPEEKFQQRYVFLELSRVVMVLVASH